MLSRKRHGNVNCTMSQRQRSDDDFEQLLRSYGYIIGKENNANELDVDQVEFLKNFTKFLATNDDACSKFVNGLEKFAEDDRKFKWSLLPTATSAECKSARSACQDSLFHMLLKVETVQESVSKLLLEKVALFAYVDNGEAFDQADGKSMACMILSQFRWIPKFVNGRDLSLKLMELIKATPTEVQRDIIVLLPEIISESDHSEVASNLKVILQDNSELNAVILSTLSNLIIDAEALTSVRQEVLKSLQRANAEELPGIVRFVLTNLTTDEMTETIEELRNNLDIAPAFEPLFLSTPIGSQRSAVENTQCSQVMTTVKLLLLFEKSLCNHWLKVLESVHLPNHLHVFDILVLFILHSIDSCQKRVQDLIKKKIRGGELSENLVGQTFRDHYVVVKEYLPSIIKLSQDLVKSSESNISHFASMLYSNTFLKGDTFTKQEIIGNLVTHVTNGSFNEINTALHTFLELAKNHASLVMKFSMFVKSLMYHFDQLTLVQIRKVFEVLSFLCYKGSSDGDALEDDLHIFIRKQLMNSDLRYCKIGIIGALMAAKIACLKLRKSDNDTPDLEEVSNKQVLAWLEIVQSSITNIPEAEALFYDELSRLVNEGQFTPVVEQHIDNHILNMFEELYICSSKDVPSETLQFQLDNLEDIIILNLNGAMIQNKKKSVSQQGDDSSDSDNDDTSQSKKRKLDRKVVLSSLLEAYKSMEAKTSGSNLKPKSALTIAPMFRLLRIRKNKEHDNLDDIDGLLGCAISVPNLQPPKFEILPLQQRDQILDASLFCINWIRELINAFATVDESESKLNTILRLQLMVELQELVCKYVQYRENYMPPLANFDSDKSDRPCLKFAAKKTTKSKVTKKGKNKKSPNESMDKTTKDTQSKIEESDSDHEGDSKKNNSAELATNILTSLRPCLRELDLEMFVLLELGITFRKPCDVFEKEKSREVALHPTEISFLMEDLLSKLRYSLASSFRSRFKSKKDSIGFSNLQLKTPEKVITFSLKLFPALCHILESCCNYFKTITADSDGIVDSLLLLSIESQQISACLLLILKTINFILSWEGFALGKNADELKEALRVFATREGSLSENVFTTDLVLQSIHYLAKFEDTITSLSTAAAFLELMDIIVGFGSSAEPKKKVAEIAKNFLKRGWPELNKKGKVSDTNKNIDFILEAYLKNSEAVLETMDHLTTEALPKLTETTDSEEDSNYSTLNKSSLPSYYKILSNHLVEQMKLYSSEKKTVTKSQQFQEWARAVKIFHVLVNLIKTFSNRSIIAVSLRQGRYFLELFLKHGMPLMDDYFGTDKDEVLHLLKNLQMSTRYLQHVCTHSKVMKDLVLLRHVPFLKKMLESYVYRVKQMLAINKCGEAFWLGNLKNRDLKGVEIMSQTVNDDDEEEEEKDQEDNDDDDNESNDETVASDTEV